MKCGVFPMAVLGFLLGAAGPIPCAPVPAAGQPTTEPSAALLRDRLDRLVTAPRFRHAQWGIQVMDLESGTVLYEHEADRLLTPASLTKLFTAALALDRLGGDHQLRTRVYTSSAPDRRGRLASPLILRGEGDPGFRWEEDAEPPLRSFEPLVRVVQQAGIRELRGGLLALETWLGGQKYGPGWSWEDLPHGYGAPLSDLVANENRVRLEVRPRTHAGDPCEVRLYPGTSQLWITNLATTGLPGRQGEVRWTRLPGQRSVFVTGRLPAHARAWTDSISVEEPAAFFLELFQRALESRGVRVGGPLRVVGPADPDSHRIRSTATLLGEVRSAPVRELVRAMLKRSENLHASVLWAAVIRASGTTPADERNERPPDAAPVWAAFLRDHQIPVSEVILEEGSGLSRNNLVTPRAVVALLRAMTRHPEAGVFQDALPVAGRDGTLSGRMIGTAAEGVVHAKTGTLRWAHGLAGYVLPEQGRSLAFCVLLNRYQPGPEDPPPRDELDRLAILLAEWSTGSIER
ncbi:D-alanyl-D-alanine carboxypeptidase/D-alanyl-D-alanine endopeptidase [Limisphaera sp. 4302-co]|uniref:D-alanyl-D-alanine carboxypeptidase/D-alanyl-D-alanine endopeptidase n=1 Tax=Limisphaera sp. 4302-co TaxID=3400417 RepID=UPI003C148843